MDLDIKSFISKCLIFFGGFILLVFGSMFLLITYTGVFGIRTEGTLIGVQQDTEEGFEGISYPIFSFKDENGKEYTIEKTGNSFNPQGLNNGDKITVVYLKGKPENALVYTSDYYTEPIPGILYSLVFLVTGILLRKKVKEAKKIMLEQKMHPENPNI